MDVKEGERTDLDSLVQRSRDLVNRAMDEVRKALVGQHKMIEGMFMGVLAGGHVLLEGVPGLAKTLAIRVISDVIDAGFKRIQFTPDLLPADLTGTMIYRPQTGEFIPRKGPIFSNIILADEINRAPAKVQAALLEAMEEHQVTIGDNTYPLAEPFFVLATQNPIEQEGTYPLPEAQLDRFLLKLAVHYPSKEEELEILRRVGSGQEINVERKILKADIRRLREVCSQISVDERIEQYIVDIVSASRDQNRNINAYSRYIEFGASPRATLALFRCAKARALLEGRSYVVPEDVKYVAPAVLRHRVILSYEAESDELHVDEVIQALLSAVPVP